MEAQNATGSDCAIHCDEQWIQYSFLDLSEYDFDCPVTFEALRALGNCGTGSCKPAYHARNRDVPVAKDAVGGSCCVSGTLERLQPFSVVRMWPVRNVTGTVEHYVFHEEPVQDILRRTGEGDADGEIAFLRVFNQSLGVWQDGQEVRLVSAE